ncbi:peptidoglycan DD-metalloendopeptidase family protein [Cognatiyoonia koreensis]|nr:M23 family metallopeptidase [Cognatiyoonia koreensis]
MVVQIAAAAGGCLVLLFIVGVIFLRPDGRNSGEDIATLSTDNDLVPVESADEQIVQVETGQDVPAVRLATPFVDIPGDPMILRFASKETDEVQKITGPANLDPARFGPPTSTRLAILREDLVVQESQLITALPSSREDFAFFQAQRTAAIEAVPSTPRLTDVDADADLNTVVVDDMDNSLGEALGADSDGGITTYRETKVENNTSVALIRSEASRTTIYEDVVVRLETDRTLADVLASNGLPDETLPARIAKAMPALADIQTEDKLKARTIVAARFRGPEARRELLQISVYGPDAYVGSVAKSGVSQFSVSSDPWIEADLPRLASASVPDAVQSQDFRLLDAVYSAAIRNDIPTTLVGEMIVMLSQAYDLEAVAAPGDKVTIIYAPDAKAGPSQIVFTGIKGPSGNMPCYVAPRTEQVGDIIDYGCYSATGPQGHSASTGGGFTTPVAGTLSSPFGPRHHPILRQVRLHAGVDWAAPTGTPIVAALDGKYAVIGDGGGYGNVIYINHANGLQSRYAHMSKFADAARVGKPVRAGEVIGYVGTTGRSTGPHLHFEIRRNGEPIDPFLLGHGGVVTIASGGGLTASAAVEALTNQIIQVESAGNANAKNPLSTATGLGQFIESTWLRMMRDYRPDLHSTMSRTDLLALRTDPTLSRQMVMNLARENENFLRARGHHVDAGRLYLAHFLGPAGASTALSADDNATVLSVMGANVVNANPFLRNYRISDLEAWAQRKMRGAGFVPGGAPSAPRPPPMTATVRSFIASVDEILAELG